ncbi:GNAT family N-acetyltransferase [Enterobacter hormaechei]
MVYDGLYLFFDNYRYFKMWLPSFKQKSVNNIERPRFEVLHIWDRIDPTKYWGTCIVETIYRSSVRDNYPDITVDKLSTEEIEIIISRIDEKPKKQVSFKAWYSNHYPISTGGEYSAAVCITGRDLCIRDSEYRGHRIGTWAMSEIIKWVKQWPDAYVLPILISDTDAYKENKKRRDFIYKNIGVEFNYSNDNKTSGLSYPLLVSELNVINSWDKKSDKHGNIITEPFTDFLNGLINDKKVLTKENEELHSLNEKLESQNHSSMIKKIIDRLRRF